METKKRPHRRSSIIPLSKSAAPRNEAKIFSTKFSMSIFVKRVNKLTQSQRDAVKRTGFGNLLLIGNRMIAKTLLNALMERWHPKKRAFVLGKAGIISITPLDVALILGLRVTGKPVNSVREMELPFVELEAKHGATLWNRKITVALIDERLEKLGEKDDGEFVRLFLLFTFGTLLFPNTSEKVDSRYLYFLQELDSIGKFAWGIAVLDDLAEWLSKRKEENVQYVGGCLILLQIWLYEHIDVGRPSLRNQDIKFPRACRWDNSKSHQRDWSSLQFRNLQTNQISWYLDLTLEELELEIVKELLLSQREKVTTHIDLDSQAGGALASEDCYNLFRSSPEKASTSMRTQLFPKYGAYCSQDKQNPNAIVTDTDMSNNEQDGALANEKQIPNFISVNNDVCNNQGDGALVNNDCSNKLSSLGDQCSSPSASCCPQVIQRLNFIDISSDNGCSNQLRSICDLACTSLADQCSSPSASCCPQVRQRLNFVDISSDDNEGEPTSEDYGVKREISKLRKENMNLRKEVESLKHQNLLHLSAFNIVTRLNSIVFSEIADEVLGTNL